LLTIYSLKVIIRVSVHHYPESPSNHFSRRFTSFPSMLH